MKVMDIIKNKKHEITVNPGNKHKIFYRSFDSNIAIKVKRISGFLDEIYDNEAAELSRNKVPG